MANIFFTHTPFHLYIAEKIINQFLQNDVNIIFCEFSPGVTIAKPTIPSANFYDLINVGGRTPGRLKNRIVEDNVLKIISLTETNISLNYYMSDVAWPMNNRVFFGSEFKGDKYLFIDGIGNYIGQMVTKRLLIRNIGKSILGYLGLGVKYKLYTGDVVGQNQSQVSAIYAFKTQFLSESKAKKIEIEIFCKKKKMYRTEKIGIFLDQPFIKGYESWNLLRFETIRILSEMEIDCLYYKGHHFGQVKDFSPFQEMGARLITTSECIEQYIEGNWFDVVISYNSTALFTLKAIYGDSIECIAIDVPGLVMAATQNDLDANNKLKNIYKKIGVNIISLNL